MLSLFRRSISVGTLLQLVLELSWVFVAGMLVLRFHDGMSFARLSIVVPALMFAIVMVMLNGAFGVYQRSVSLSQGAYALRVVVALLIAVPVAYLGAELLPGGDVFQEKLGLAVVFSVGGLLLVRHFVVLPLVRLLRLFGIISLIAAPLPTLWSATRG